MPRPRSPQQLFSPRFHPAQWATGGFCLPVVSSTIAHPPPAPRDPSLDRNALPLSRAPAASPPNCGFPGGSLISATPIDIRPRSIFAHSWRLLPPSPENKVPCRMSRPRSAPEMGMVDPPRCPRWIPLHSPPATPCRDRQPHCLYTPPGCACPSPSPALAGALPSPPVRGLTSPPRRDKRWGPGEKMFPWPVPWQKTREPQLCTLKTFHSPAVSGWSPPAPLPRPVFVARSVTLFPRCRCKPCPRGNSPIVPA